MSFEEFEKSVRKRPGMYIGEVSAVGLLNGLIIECIEHCKTDEITFEIAILGDNDFTIGLSSQQDLSLFIQQFTDESINSLHCFPKVMKVLSETFEIITQEHSKTEIAFSLDKTIFSNTSIDYMNLSDKMLQITLLNRRCEIITIDKRQKYLNQNYFHFPQGVFYLFDRATTEVLGKPELKIIFDGEVGLYMLQLGLAYRTDWFPTPNIISFANDVHTVCGGSLVDGVMDGVLDACKRYIEDNHLTKFKVNRKKLANGLILICAIRGDALQYGGSWKETLDDYTVKKEVKKLVSGLVSAFLKTEKEKAANFLWRFDTTQLMSRIY